jgi:hypothetical protein
VLNLTHRESHSEPSALSPGTVYTIRLKLNDCGHAFAPGHRLRLALSNAYWPLIWPAPEAAILTLQLPGRLVLPARPPDQGEAEIRFEPPISGKPAPISKVKEGRLIRSSTLDLMTGTSTYVTHGEGGLFGEGALRFDEIGTEINHGLRRELTISADDPLSARYTIRQDYELGRAGWHILIEVETAMRATATQFILEGHVRTFENGALSCARDFAETIARDLV